MTSGEPNQSSEAASVEDNSVLVRIVLILLIALGAALRLHRLGDESLWLDESVTWLQTRGDIWSTIVANARDTYPPLHNLLTLPFVALLGPTEVALRLPSAIFATLAIPATYWVGRRASGPWTGVVAAAIMTLSPLAVLYGQEARMYALMTLGAALFAGAILGWLAQPSRRRSLVVLGAGFVLLYSHPYGLPAWASIAAAAAAVLWRRGVDRKTFRRFIGLQGLVLLVFLPWLVVTVTVVGRLIDHGFWIPRPDLALVADYALGLAGGPLGLGLLVAGWICALPVVGRILRPVNGQSARLAEPGALAVLLALLVGPLLFGFLVSQIMTPILTARYLLCSLPAAAVIAAIGFSRLGSGPSALPVQLGLVGLLLVPALANMPLHRKHEDWRSLARELAFQMHPDDCLVLVAYYNLPSLQFYGVEPPACFYLDLGKAAAAIGPDRRVLMISAHSQDTLAEFRKAMPGNWSDERLFGDTVRFAIREPAP